MLPFNCVAIAYVTICCNCLCCNCVAIAYVAIQLCCVAIAYVAIQLCCNCLCYYLLQLPMLQLCCNCLCCNSIRSARRCTRRLLRGSARVHGLFDGGFTIKATCPILQPTIPRPALSPVDNAQHSPQVLEIYCVQVCELSAIYIEMFAICVHVCNLCTFGCNCYWNDGIG